MGSNPVAVTRGFLMFSGATGTDYWSHTLATERQLGMFDGLTIGEFPNFLFTLLVKKVLPKNFTWQ